MASEGGQRASNACENCRRRKVKCSGDQPCKGCLRHNAECTYGGTGRKRFSESYVQGLLDRIQSYERRLNEPLSDLNQHGQKPQQSETTEDINNRNSDHPSASREPVTSTSPAPGLASGPSFESQARTLLNRNRHDDTSYSAYARANFDPDWVGDHGDELVQWQSIEDLIHHDATFTLPTEAESRRLLELFLLYLGSNQHFVDTRLFLDFITLLYRSSTTRQRQQKSLWFTQYLLIMAMARLMDANSDANSMTPGSDFFAEAIRRLPPLHSLGEHGVISVEILALVALYLQWCDKKYDAYLHIGVAIRLAIALQCNQPINRQTCLPSEASHRLRLWWTVFMLDRRLSASLGLPVGADDRQIHWELPQAAVGFPSHIPIAINVRIARATGDIMTSLYGSIAISQDNLVQKIQDILQSLYETGKSIPPEFEIDFSRPQLQVTRTGSSLFLMLFQAIILCVRPIVLQQVRQSVQRSPSQTAQTTPAIISRLCQTCDEASRKSLRILMALQQKDMIARYGFFDLDATFAAAFMLVMLCSMDGKQVEKPPKELRMACEILCYLSRSGNKAARRRLDDITQFCSHVWPNHHLPHLRNSADKSRLQGQAGPDNSPKASSSLKTNRQARFNNVDTSPAGNSEQSLGENVVSWPGMAEFDASIASFDLEPAADGIYSSYNDPNFQLTGIDYADWQEMERFFAERHG